MSANELMERMNSDMRHVHSRVTTQGSSRVRGGVQSGRDSRVSSRYSAVGFGSHTIGEVEVDTIVRPLHVLQELDTALMWDRRRSCHHCPINFVSYCKDTPQCSLTTQQYRRDRHSVRHPSAAIPFWCGGCFFTSNCRVKGSSTGGRCEIRYCAVATAESPLQALPTPAASAAAPIAPTATMSKAVRPLI